MSRRVVVRLEVPKAYILTSNQRLHWAEAARRVRFTRQLAAAMCSASPPPLTGAHCEVTIQCPDRRRRDAHNLMPTIKAAIDGMVQDAGLLADDSDRYLVGPDLRVGEPVKSDGVRLTFTFTETELFNGGA